MIPSSFPQRQAACWISFAFFPKNSIYLHQTSALFTFSTPRPNQQIVILLRMVTLYSSDTENPNPRHLRNLFSVIILIGCLNDEGYQRKVMFNATKNDNEHWIVYFYCYCKSQCAMIFTGLEALPFQQRSR